MITPGTRVRFNTDDQYYGDEYGVVAGTVPRRHYYEKIVYRISLEKVGTLLRLSIASKPLVDNTRQVILRVRRLVLTALVNLTWRIPWILKER